MTMFTLNRVTSIGVGAGLVLVGCASPVEDTEDPTAEASAALTEEAVVDETADAIGEEADAVMPAGIASAFELAGMPAPPSDEAMPEEDKDDPTSEKWLGGGLGWGGLGWGGLGWGGLGWGGVGAFPGYSYGYASPWGFGYSRAIGYGTSFGYPAYGGFFW